MSNSRRTGGITSSGGCAAWIALTVTTLAFSLACITEDPGSSPKSMTIEPVIPELIPGRPDCATLICCIDCPDINVERVIDGDTFVSANARIRLFGVDTPERGEQCFSDATERLRELAGARVKVEQGPRARDPSGRRLFYVFTGDGESIDETLVREGLALAWTRDGQHREALVQAEQGARRNGTGCLW